MIRATYIAHVKNIAAICTVIFLGLPSNALAGDHFTFNGTLFYRDHEGVSENSEVKTGNLDLGIGAGYLLGSGLYIGLAYVRDKLETTAGTATDTIIFSSYGVAIGFMKKNSIVLSGAYLINPTAEETGTNANSGQSNSQILKGGTGTFLQLGYPLALNSSFCIGPVLSQLNMTYKKRDTTANGTTVNESLSGTWSDKWTRLAFGIWYDL